MSVLAGQELLDLAGEDPARALDEIKAALGAPALAAEDEALLRRARGVALRCVGRTSDSADELSIAASLAGDLNDNLLAGVETSLAATLLFLGQVPQALATMDAAIARSDGMQHIETLLQASTIRLSIGRHEEALALLSQAIPLAQQTGRVKWESDSLNQRGMALIFGGQSGRALADLERSITLASDNGDAMGAAMASCNRALALHRVGRLAESLASFREVAADYETVGISAHEIAGDWSEALLAAGLFDDAVRTTSEAARHFRQTGNVWGAMQCTALAAEAALAAGNADLVDMIFRAAGEIPGAADFAGWRARIELARLRSQADVSPDAIGIDQIDSLIQILAESGQADAALTARITRLQVAGTGGESTSEGLRAAVDRAPALVQLHYWSTLTAIRAQMGGSGATLRAFGAAERRARAILATTGSYEVRVHASRHLERAADAATQVLIERRRIGDLVALVERRRGGALTQPAGHASDEFREALTRYRDMEARLRSVGDDAAPVIKHRAALERDVQDLARRQESAIGVVPIEAQLAPNESVLTFLVHDGQLLRVERRAGRRSRLDTVGPISSVTDLIGELLFSHRQLARRSRLTEASKTDLICRHEAIAAELESLLLPEHLSRRVVLNPPPSMQNLPWASLPSLFEREHCVSPSLQLARRPLPGPEPSVVLYGASELPHARHEVEVLGAMASGRGIVDPDGDGLTMAAGQDVLHLAGHFVSNGANPLFDAIRLGSVDFYGYDFQGLESSPRLVVLASCASGTVGEVAAAPFGYAMAAIGAGASAVIVSHTAVEDSPRLVACMEEVYAALLEGRGPADALKAARLKADGEDRILASTFGVLGTGWSL